MRAIPRVFLIVAIVGFAAVAANVHQELMSVPRIRVGPLKSEVPAGDSLRFFALGDFGTGGEAQLKVAAAMEKRCQASGADAMLLLGDNAYPAGFNSVDDPQWQTKVLGPYGSPCLSKLPMYAVLGNHDYKENPSAEIEFSLIYPRWHMPNRFYSVKFGSLVNLVALDSNVTDFCFNPAFCGMDFMAEAVAHHDTTWTIAMAHHPVASQSGHGFAYRGGLRGLFLKPYLCDKIDVWLSGHSHHLEHREPEGCRMQMFVAGGGGADLYKPVEPANPPDPEVRFVKMDYGFLELELNRKELIGRMISDDGSVAYETRRAATPATEAERTPSGS